MLLSCTDENTRPEPFASKADMNADTTLQDNLMLVSHCGEYMANGLTNAVRHQFVMIANDRQTFVAVRKHSRSFLWCFECYAGLTSGECMANGLTNAIRHQFAMIAL